MREHRSLIALQARKIARINYWRPIIARDLGLLLVISWYIKVELLRTHQLPPYMTFSQIDRVPALKDDIESQASLVFKSAFGREDKFNMFCVADTCEVKRNGNMGIVTSYDHSTSRFNTKTCPSNVWNSNEVVFTSHAIEFMEPLHRHQANSITHDSLGTAVLDVTIQNHFPGHDQGSLLTKFRVAQFIDLLKYNAHPDQGPPCCRAKLISLLNDAETEEREDAAKVEAERVELQKGLARLHSVRTPALQRPRKKIRNGGRQPNPQRMTQVRCIWKAKIEHYLSNKYSSRGDDSEHLFTFPFETSDNSLHTCSEGLTELGSLRDRGLIHDGMYMKNNLTESTVINASSVKSTSPGDNIDGNVLDFCLSW
jgi:hypothetical protein